MRKLVYIVAIVLTAYVLKAQSDSACIGKVDKYMDQILVIDQNKRQAWYYVPEHNSHLSFALLPATEGFFDTLGVISLNKIISVACAKYNFKTEDAALILKSNKKHVWKLTEILARKRSSPRSIIYIIIEIDAITGKKIKKYKIHSLVRFKV